MALRMNADMKNVIINNMIVKIAGTMGTGGTALLTIFTGTQPAVGGGATSGTSGTILCTIIAIGWGGTTGDSSTTGCIAGTIGLAAAVSGYTGTAVSTGTAGWARIATIGTSFAGTACTFCIDGDVGTAATSTFVINSVSITAGGAVTVLSCPISLS
jgi:hypothetical protein